MDLDEFLAFQGITKQQYDALEPKNQKTLYNDYLNANPRI